MLPQDAVNPASRLTAGTSVGPYEIVEAIGRGGMGEVYRARDTRLNRHVAIKILPSRFTQLLSRIGADVTAMRSRADYSGLGLN